MPHASGITTDAPSAVRLALRTRVHFATARTLQEGSEFRVRNCTLSSAQTRFTVLFGMGRRGSRLLWPPDGRLQSAIIKTSVRRGHDDAPQIPVAVRGRACNAGAATIRIGATVAEPADPGDC